MNDQNIAMLQKQFHDRLAALGLSLQVYQEPDPSSPYDVFHLKSVMAAKNENNGKLAWDFDDNSFDGLKSGSLYVYTHGDDEVLRRLSKHRKAAKPREAVTLENKVRQFLAFVAAKNQAGLSDHKKASLEKEMVDMADDIMVVMHNPLDAEECSDWMKHQLAPDLWNMSAKAIAGAGFTGKDEFFKGAADLYKFAETMDDWIQNPETRAQTEKNIKKQAATVTKILREYVDWHKKIMGGHSFLLKEIRKEFSKNYGAGHPLAVSGVCLSKDGRMRESDDLKRCQAIVMVHAKDADGSKATANNILAKELPLVSGWLSGNVYSAAIVDSESGSIVETIDNYFGRDLWENGMEKAVDQAVKLLEEENAADKKNTYVAPRR